jgi:hypothetical protein
METEKKNEEFKPNWWVFLFFGGFGLFSAYAGVWWGTLLFAGLALLTFPNKDTHKKIMGITTGFWSGIKGLLYLGLILLLIGGGLWFGGKVLGGLFGGSSDYSSAGSYSDYDEDSSQTISYDEAIDNYWDDIQDYVDGTETVEACYDYSNCYDLDADISSGYLETLHFNNGGYLSFYAEFDDGGYASDTDDEGRDWEFTLDMNSPTVEDAVSNWASDNEYTIE